MKLVEFRIQNYRSVIDSGPVRVDRQLALLGRNESGKTNLMTALASLNPPQSVSELSFVRDFPRDREIDDYDPDLRVVDTVWTLDDAECKELVRRFPRAGKVSEITVGRAYAPTRFVGFRDLPDLSVDTEALGKHLLQLRRALLRTIRDRDDESLARIAEQALNRLGVSLEVVRNPAAWATAAEQALAEFRRTLRDEDLETDAFAEEALAALEDLHASIANDPDAQTRAMNWLIERLPAFVYLADIPELDGHMDLTTLARRIQADTLESGDIAFLRLARIGGFDPLVLVGERDEGHERRQQWVHRAGAAVTRKFRRLWSDRAIKVRFNLDGDRFDILVSDPAAVYDMEVNLNERSRGFRWFFALYVLLAADDLAGSGAESGARESILLLDEPGLHLHALGQKDLLKHLTHGLDNQIVFATHSPFMVPMETLGGVRTVSYTEEHGTVCANTPRGDARTLYPLQAAMAYASEEGLFGDQPVLMVPDLSDYLILGAMSAHLTARGRCGLPDDAALVPMGGLERAVYMLSTFSGDHHGLALLVNDADPRWSRIGPLLGAQAPVLRAGQFRETDDGTGGGLEDLLPEAAYERLARACYEAVLSQRALELDPTIPDIARRYRAAFEAQDLAFQPARVAALFMRRVMEGKKGLPDAATEDRFEALFIQVDRCLG